MFEVDEFSDLDSENGTPESICANVARIFRVRTTEVALLELHGSRLTFLYPVELKTVGAIPLSSSAVSARSARTKRAELFNSFARVRHSSVFEVVKLRDDENDAEVIQKLMSAPVMAESGDVIGVLQVSRKGRCPETAGPDFTPEDLQELKSVATAVGKRMAKLALHFNGAP